MGLQLFIINPHTYLVSAAKNSVEVYIRNGGTKSRCSQYCGTLQGSEGNLSLHQVQNGSQDVTPSIQKTDSSRINGPNLRRYVIRFLIVAVFDENLIENVSKIQFQFCLSINFK